MEIDDEVGARIKALRLERGRSQAELAGPGLSAPYLSLIESGTRRPSPGALRRVAEALGTTVEQLGSGHVPNTWQEAERRIAFAEMAVNHGSAAEALAEIDEVLTTCPAPFHDRALLIRGGALETLGRLEEAIGVYQELWSRTEPGTVAWAERAVDVMRCDRGLGDMSAAIALGEQAMHVFEELGLEWTTEAVRLGVSLAGQYKNRGDLARSKRLIERMMATAEALGDPLARGSAYWNAALLARAQARYEDALTLIRKAVALFGETDNLRNTALLRRVYAYTLLAAEADLAEAGTRLDEARALTESIGNKTDLAEIEIGGVLLSLRQGEPQQAVTHARTAIALTRFDSGAPRTAYSVVAETEAHTALAHALFAAGDPDGARAALESAEQLFSEERHGELDQVGVWKEIGDAWAALGDPGRAFAAYQRAFAYAGHAGGADFSVGLPVPVPVPGSTPDPAPAAEPAPARVRPRTGTKAKGSGR